VPLYEAPPPDQVQGHRSRFELLVEMITEQSMTIRDLVRWHISGRTHRNFVGTPEQLADEMELWLHEGGADGFNIMPSLNSNGLNLFVDHVVPLLQAKGIYRREYTADTLRGHYGLNRVPWKDPR